MRWSVTNAGSGGGGMGGMNYRTPSRPHSIDIAVPQQLAAGASVLLEADVASGLPLVLTPSAPSPI